METRVVVVALLAAAVLGIVTGGAVALVSGDDPGAQASGSGMSGSSSSDTPEAAPPTPTATPVDDRPSPDVGYVTEVKDRNGGAVLVFDRTTVLIGEDAEAAAAERGEEVQPGGWYLVNDNDRTRDLVVTEAAASGTEAVRRKLSGGADSVAVVVTYDDGGELDSLRELTLV